MGIDYSAAVRLMKWVQLEKGAASKHDYTIEAKGAFTHFYLHLGFSLIQKDFVLQKFSFFSQCVQQNSMCEV